MIILVVENRLDILPQFLKVIHYVVLQREEIDSEEDRNIDLSRSIPSGTNKSLPIFDSVLTGLSDR